jgi:hypothetical protein
MKSPAVRLAAGLLLVSFLCGVVSAQQPRPQRQPGQGNNRNNAPKLPDDPRLLEIHKQFVQGAEKLALEYAANKEFDKARDCYAEILRLVPTYGPAESKLKEIRGKQAIAQRIVMDVMANKGWQDTGIDVIQGKPLVINASGHWKFNLEGTVGADGFEIPKELRRYNLGSLIGMIVPPEKPAATTATNPASESTPPPAESAANAAEKAATEGENKEEEKDNEPRLFVVGKTLDTNARISGRLFLRMYDSSADDNVGKLSVAITGTFSSAPTR